MTKIKICGLKLKNDFEFVASLNVDYAGIIFVENVKRQISTTAVSYTHLTLPTKA